MTYADLSQISQIELVYKRKIKASDRPKVKRSQDAEKLFRQNWNDCNMDLCEEFKILFLDRNNDCMGISSLSKGGVSGTIADPKIIFATALKVRANSIICAHNHPSGCLDPSYADVILTKRLVQVGKYLTLPVNDHLILTREGYYSMTDNGLIPN
ncbi:MAG: JAB domain-containing protein [Bacteroidota bacterium]